MASALIRPATTADIPAVARIYADAVLHSSASFELEPPSEAEMARRHAVVTEKGLPYLVAERGGVVAGYAYAGLYHARPGYRYTLEDSIYVATDAQRNGIGRALLTRLLVETEVLGFRQMIAVIGDSGNLGSITLHRELGFQDVGIMRSTGFKFGRWIDTVFMQRALGKGGTTTP